MASFTDESSLVRHIYTPDFRMFAPVDALIIIAILWTIGLSMKTLSQTGSNEVLIYRDTMLYGRYPLNQDKTITIHGVHGDVVVCIAHNAVRICQSSCKNQLCVKTGARSKPFHQIVCAPNHVLIIIQSAHLKDTLDAISH